MTIRVTSSVISSVTSTLGPPQEYGSNSPNTDGPRMMPTTTARGASPMYNFSFKNSESMPKMTMKPPKKVYARCGALTSKGWKDVMANGTGGVGGIYVLRRFKRVTDGVIARAKTSYCSCDAIVSVESGCKDEQGDKRIDRSEYTSVVIPSYVDGRSNKRAAPIGVVTMSRGSVGDFCGQKVKGMTQGTNYQECAERDDAKTCGRDAGGGPSEARFQEFQVLPTPASSPYRSSALNFRADIPEGLRSIRAACMLLWASHYRCSA